MNKHKQRSSEALATWPARIFLQSGDDDTPNFSDCREVTWATEPIGETDVEYVRADLSHAQAAAPASADQPISLPAAAKGSGEQRHVKVDREEFVEWVDLVGQCLMTTNALYQVFISPNFTDRHDYARKLKDLSGRIDDVLTRMERL